MRIRGICLAIAVAVGMVCTQEACAQKWSLGTNLVDYVNFGTLNLEGQVALSRHVTLDLQTRQNPFIYNKDNRDDRIFSCRQEYFAGVKIWPWASFSGWWFKTGAQWQEYSREGLEMIFPFADGYSREGCAAGLVVGAGWSHMISKCINFDLGIEGWGGYERYNGMKITDGPLHFREGERLFLLPNNVTIGFSFIFGRAKNPAER